jgi:hypothetical protein
MRLLQPWCNLHIPQHSQILPQQSSICFKCSRGRELISRSCTTLLILFAFILLLLLLLIVHVISSALGRVGIIWKSKYQMTRIRLASRHDSLSSALFLAAK